MLRKFLNRVHCALRGHPGAYREWEWNPLYPQWQERTDVWNCIRCEIELLTIPPTMPTYIVDRPHLDANVVDFINDTIDNFGENRVRVRAGDPITRRPRTQ